MQVSNNYTTVYKYGLHLSFGLIGLWLYDID